VNLAYETEATIRLHRQALQREAEQQRLLVRVPIRAKPLDQSLAHIGRFLIALGTRLEARYTNTTATARRQI
jgi:hypothetical protein